MYRSKRLQIYSLLRMYQYRHTVPEKFLILPFVLIK